MARVLVTGGSVAVKMYFVYLLQSLVYDQLYIGSTNHLEKRLQKHNQGKIVSTNRYKPWGVIYYEAYLTEETARWREKQLKYHGNAKRELYKRLGLTKKKEVSNEV